MEHVEEVLDRHSHNDSQLQRIDQGRQAFPALVLGPDRIVLVAQEVSHLLLAELHPPAVDIKVVGFVFWFWIHRPPSLLLLIDEVNVAVRRNLTSREKMAEPPLNVGPLWIFG